jgi:hypothetical protein
MLISHEHKFLTIDIPKTGSRSLRESLCPMGIIDIVGTPYQNKAFYQHGTALDCTRDLEKNNCNFDDYYSFCVVRDPWERYFSFFKYYKSYKERYLNRDKSIDWKEPEINQGKFCVELLENKDSRTVLKHIILSNPSQDSFYCDRKMEVIVDHIAVFENFEREFALLCNNVGITTPTLKHGNKSKDPLNMHETYNQELIDLVASKENNVIKLKGYDYIT